MMGGILMAIVGVAALSLLFAPDSKAADVIKVSGNSFANSLLAAKSWPSTNPTYLS